MDSEHAIEVLENLANGVNPATGEVFQYDSPYNNPLIIRALFSILVLLRTPQRKRTVKQRQADNVRSGMPRNYGMPWPQEMLDELLAQYQASVSTADLASQYERSEASIIAQLIRLGAISPDKGRHYSKP